MLGCQLFALMIVVKDGAKRRRLRRSSILDKIINANSSAVHAIKAASRLAVLHDAIRRKRVSRRGIPTAP